MDLSKRTLWIEIPLVVLTSIYIVLNIAILSHSFDESPISKFLLLWIYCAFAAITAFGTMIYLAVNHLNKNCKRILFVLCIFFTNFGIICEFYSNSEFLYLNVLFHTTFGISFVCLIVTLILMVIYYCSQSKNETVDI